MGFSDVILMNRLKWRLWSATLENRSYKGTVVSVLVTPSQIIHLGKARCSVALGQGLLGEELKPPDNDCVGELRVRTPASGGCSLQLSPPGLNATLW